MKVAITTTDGVSVNEHFGKANQFYIYSIENNKVNFVEKRIVQAYCTPGNTDHDFNWDRFMAVYEEIKDCKVLYTKQIGDTPLDKFKNCGMLVKKCQCEISEIPVCSGKCKH